MSRLLAPAALVALCAALAPAGDKADDGFMDLFNGKDLTGWQYKGSKEDLAGKTSTADGRFQVIDGAIVAVEKDRDGKGGIKDLYTAKSFGKGFRLKLEFRAGPKSDSGVYLRGQQLQVRDFPRLGQQKQLTKFRNDDWNSLDIVVENDVLTTTLNGKSLGKGDSLAFSFADGKPKATLNGKEVDAKSVQVRNANVARAEVNGEPLEVMANLPGTGAVGLQAEAGKFEFRRVRIKEQ